jgi:AcrR family transcriptional regulator
MASSKVERQPLTRERVLEAALALMEAEGLGAVSMRRLGRELGVEAMSLYNHVADKDDVLSGIQERVMSEFPLPEPSGDWIEHLRAMARSFRELLIRHPGVVALLSSHAGRPLSDPRSLRPIEVVLETLRSAGLSEDDTVHAYRALVGFVMGNAVLEIGGFFGEWSEREGWPDAEAMAAQLPAEELPTVVSMLPALWSCDATTEFERGLDVLLEGLRSRLMAAPADG